MKRVVLAFSGGRGTMAALHILKRRFGRNVITFTANLGQRSSTEGLCERAIELGASSAHIADLREPFLRDYVWPALRAGAVCSTGYALAHALARPLIVKELVRIAKEEGASCIAHGCAAKSNDQVRFEISAAALAPELKVLSPLREANLLRQDEVVRYCRQHRLPTEVDECRFSITENLYGASVQWDRAPDPFANVPEDVYRQTAPIAATPDEPSELQISFKEGLPTALDGEVLPPVQLVERLKTVAGTHGVGRLTTVEDRLIGIKMVEVYEQPAATALHRARQALERLVLSKDLLDFKEKVSARYAAMTYEGFWFSELRAALDGFVASSSRFVTGDVRLSFFRGNCEVKGVRSIYSLYSQGLADPSAEGDRLTHQAVQGFVETLKQPLRSSTRTPHR
ncbi:MAG: argininosuccinate synthase [Planctomycetota bacterium]|nr:MAG: argininosuccinate synthase [Planctomycetota bacterium]